MLSDSLKLKGHYRIEVREHGKLIKVVELDNVLTELYRTAVINALMSGENIEMGYFAVGTDDTPANANDTQLGAEIFRSTPTQQSHIGNTLVTTWVLTPEQANSHLKEIGVFIGDSAEADLNSGILMSRINIDILKTSAMEVTFRRTDFIII